MSSNIILVLGAGPNIGLQTIKFFSSKGFKTVAVSRKPIHEISSIADLTIKCDFSDPKTIAAVFAEVRSKIGIPNVVVYNAYTSPMNPDPFAISLEEFTAATNINLLSPYAAIQEAVRGFRELENGVLKTFIYTGNACPHITVPALMTLGVGKVGTAHMVEAASIAYKDEGFRFYFADERTEDAAPMFSGLGGQAHAETYYELVTREHQGLWEYTFVKGKGYVDFEGKVGAIPKREDW